MVDKKRSFLIHFIKLKCLQGTNRFSGLRMANFFKTLKAKSMNQSFTQNLNFLHHFLHPEIDSIIRQVFQP